MKLVAALIVKDELSRYLEPVIASLLEFCDDIRVVDDYSQDGTYEWLQETVGVSVTPNLATTFDEHEGKARQLLLDWVRESDPTHVLAIDGDELISDGRSLRMALAASPWTPVFSLDMQEVWMADDQALWIRQDGGWRAHGVPILWQVPTNADESWWTIKDRALSCGREPEAIGALRSHAVVTGVDILHFGWTNESERQRRYDRYMAIDGGQLPCLSPSPVDHVAASACPASAEAVAGGPWARGHTREGERGARMSAESNRRSEPEQEEAVTKRLDPDIKALRAINRALRIAQTMPLGARSRMDGSARTRQVMDHPSTHPMDQRREEGCVTSYLRSELVIASLWLIPLMIVCGIACFLIGRNL